MSRTNTGHANWGAGGGMPGRMHCTGAGGGSCICKSSAISEAFLARRQLYSRVGVALGQIWEADKTG